MAKQKIVLNEGPHHGVELDFVTKHGEFFTHEGHNYRTVADNPNAQPFAQYAGRVPQEDVGVPEVDVSLTLDSTPSAATSFPLTSKRSRAKGKGKAKGKSKSKPKKKSRA